MASFPNRLVRRGISCGLLMAAWVLTQPPAAQAADGGQARAAAYQVEAREVLKAHHWRITHDEGGTLTARHILGPDGADLGGAYAEPAGYARLTVVFKPSGATNTDVNVGIVAVHLNHVERNGHMVFDDPVPFDNAAASKSVQDLLAEAKKRLFTEHPEYAGR